MYVICANCGMAIQDAERGPIVAALEHRRAHGPMVSRVYEARAIKEFAPNPEPMRYARELYRRQYHRAKARRAS